MEEVAQLLDLWPRLCFCVSGPGGDEGLSADWLQAHVGVESLVACKTECDDNTKATAMQHNEDDRWCGCLALKGDRFADAIYAGKHTFKGACTLCDLTGARRLCR